MATDPRLNNIIQALKEKVEVLQALSREMRSKTRKREAEEIQSELTAVINEMTALHEKANKILVSKN